MSVGILFKADHLDPWDGRLVSKQEARDENGHFWMLSRYSSGKLRFRLRTGGKVTTLISSHSNLYKAGEWVFAVATYDGSAMRLYCNGVAVGSTAKSGQIGQDPNRNAYIGAGFDKNMLSATFDGKVDHAFLFDRALTGEEIARLNTEGPGLLASTDSGSTSDATPPVVDIDTPTSSSSYATTSSSVSLAGSASDDIGSVTAVSWTNSKGGSGTAQGTSDWQVDGIALQEGENVITVSAVDDAGNQGQAMLTVTYTLEVDTTPPLPPQGLVAVTPE
jgi:hypothetical protein